MSARVSSVGSVTHDTYSFSRDDVIGKGACGTVYKGRSSGRDDFVAIKAIELDQGNDLDAAGWRREIEMLQRMDHPNVLKYIDHFETDTSVHIVTSFEEKGSLQNYIKLHGVLTEIECTTFVEQILLGLEYLHSQGVVHRDVKAGNVLLSGKKVVKLADFGVASLVHRTGLDTSTPEGSMSDDIAGSVYWMSPEAIQMQNVTPSADIWSLACTILELVTGNPPNFDRNPINAMFHIVECNASPQLPEDVSDRLRDFLIPCLDRDPKNRPSAADLLSHPWLRQRSPQALRAVAEPSKEESPGMPLLRDLCTKTTQEFTEEVLSLLADAEGSLLFNIQNPPRDAACLRDWANFCVSACCAEQTIHALYSHGILPIIATFFHLVEDAEKPRLLWCLRVCSATVGRSEVDPINAALNNCGFWDHAVASAPLYMNDLLGLASHLSSTSNADHAQCLSCAIVMLFPHLSSMRPIEKAKVFMILSTSLSTCGTPTQSVANILNDSQGLVDALVECIESSHSSGTPEGVAAMRLASELLSQAQFVASLGELLDNRAATLALVSTARNLVPEAIDLLLQLSRHHTQRTVDQCGMKVFLAMATDQNLEKPLRSKLLEVLPTLFASDAGKKALCSNESLPLLASIIDDVDTEASDLSVLLSLCNDDDMAQACAGNALFCRVLVRKVIRRREPNTFVSERLVLLRIAQQVYKFLLDVTVFIGSEDLCSVLVECVREETDESVRGTAATLLDAFASYGKL